MNRRTFLKLTGLGLVGIYIAPLWRQVMIKKKMPVLFVGSLVDSGELDHA